MSRATVAIAVVGMPGHGKSSLLNGLARNRKLFQTAPGKLSCTQDVSQKTVLLEYGTGASTETFAVDLIDTPGFPDPDPLKAVPYYNAVVAACNQKINAIVWVVRMERELHSIVSQYTALLREFNNASCPIIMVVNGTESYEDDEERDEKKAGHREAAIQFGHSIARAAGVSVKGFVAGTEKRDLQTVVRDDLAFELAGTYPVQSRIKDYATLEKETKQCLNAEDMMRLELQKQTEEAEKLKSNIAAEENRISALGREVNGWVWIPIIGWVVAASKTLEKNSAYKRKGELLKENAETNQKLEQTKGNRARLKGFAEMARERFEALQNALHGQRSQSQ